MAEALFRNGNQAGALERYYAAVEADHDYLEAWTQIGCLHAAQGELPWALDAFSIALSVHADYPDAHWHLADVLVQLGRPEEAVAHWQKYLEYDRRGPWADQARQRLKAEISEAARDAVTVVQCRNVHCAGIRRPVRQCPIDVERARRHRGRARQRHPTRQRSVSLRHRTASLFWGWAATDLPGVDVRMVRIGRTIDIATPASSRWRKNKASILPIARPASPSSVSNCSICCSVNGTAGMRCGRGRRMHLLSLRADDPLRRVRPRELCSDIDPDFL